MKVDLAARPSGMGGAFVSIAGDPNAPTYNPAGAVSSTGFCISLGHNTYWEDIRIETACFTALLGRRTYIHGGIRLASIGDIEERQMPTLEPDAVFDAKDYSIRVGLAYQFNDRFSGGFAWGWFLEKIGAWRGSTYCIDAGILYTVKPAIVLGASVTNYGSDFTLDLSGNPVSRDISLPVTYRAGGSYRYDKCLGALDVVFLDEKVHVHVGTEAELRSDFSIRSGYMFNYDSKNFTAGASFSRHNLTFDYAFVPYSNDLGTSHLFNLTISL